MAKKRRLRKSGHFNNPVTNSLTVAPVADNSTVVVDIAEASDTNVETVLEVKTAPVVAPPVIEVERVVEENVVPNNTSVEVEVIPVVKKRTVTTKKSRTSKKTRTTKKSRTTKKDSPSLKLWPKRKKTVTSDED